MHEIYINITKYRLVYYYYINICLMNSKSLNGILQLSKALLLISVSQCELLLYALMVCERFVEVYGVGFKLRKDDSI